ncbi:MAG: hypothetical protein IJC85_01020, partial [Oscillospiraceae bacterium]|nr:hypothetical protein [Oscillospiraceae bacterium]
NLLHLLRWFESTLSHQNKEYLPLGWYSLFLIKYCDANHRRWFSRSSPKAATGFRACEVSSNEDFSQLLGAVVKSRSAEYPPSPTRKRQIPIGICLFQLNPPLRVGEILLRNVKYACGVRNRCGGGWI